MSLNAISMCDSLHGIVVGVSYVLLRTSDGGRSWQRMSVGAEDSTINGMTDAACLTPRTFIVPVWNVDEYYQIRTEDAGATWHRVQCDTVQQLCFVDSLHGWGAGSGIAGTAARTNEFITRTTDGGRTWQSLVRQPSRLVIGYLSVSFANLENGLVTAWDGRILRTTDGGDSWYDSDSGKLDGNEHATCVAYPTVGKAWAATIFGQMLHYDASRVSGVEADAAEPCGLALDVSPNIGASLFNVVYNLPCSGRTSVELVDARGEPIMEAVEEAGGSGTHSVHFDVSSLPSGAYFVRLRSAGGMALRRVMVMR
ncbi:MAG: T9SS type A sorting domain-containing protein [Bacteroidetes bacterium]|nr:T9SS type A sorting domain-containing protein [Bacteroidota bacterium]